jgi:hypothetical protein
MQYPVEPPPSGVRNVEQARHINVRVLKHSVHGQILESDVIQPCKQVVIGEVDQFRTN